MIARAHTSNIRAIFLSVAAIYNIAALRNTACHPFALMNRPINLPTDTQIINWIVDKSGNWNALLCLFLALSLSLNLLRHTYICALNWFTSEACSKIFRSRSLSKWQCVGDVCARLARINPFWAISTFSKSTLCVCVCLSNDHMSLMEMMWHAFQLCVHFLAHLFL